MCQVGLSQLLVGDVRDLEIAHHYLTVHVLTRQILDETVGRVDLRGAIRGARTPCNTIIMCPLPILGCLEHVYCSEDSCSTNFGQCLCVLLLLTVAEHVVYQSVRD
jgi:hypothetical protein